MKFSPKTLVWALAALVALGCAVPDASGAADASTPASMFFNITSGPEDPHPVTMALQLAGHALDAGRDVVLFFNVRGVRVPTLQLPDTLAFGDQPIKQLLTSLMERGAEVHVCPHCMAALGVDASDLVAGAQVTNRDMLFAHLDRNTVVFSY